MLQITDSSSLGLHDAGLNSQKKSRRNLSGITFQSRDLKEVDEEKFTGRGIY